MARARTRAPSERAFTLTDSFPAPVLIVTAHAEGTRAGCVVAYASAVSIDPPRFLACISKVNATFPVAMRASHLAVHALTRRDLALAELFGGETGDEIDKFRRCEWIAAADGTPILTASRTWFLGAIVRHVDFGDHVGCVLAPERWHDGGTLDHLTVRDLAAVEPGHPTG